MAVAICTYETAKNWYLKFSIFISAYKKLLVLVAAMQAAVQALIVLLPVGLKAI
ncbi:hypothetical protein [Sporomusa malonica]|uniref:hypothetical protein n=1 Tax=Sporomusa malonica TaxID=112901 RepID=UPI001592E000|nr:hypothetical protein [Sporomusa malonica]